MGTVFRAVQQPIGRRVAVKVLHPELAQDETFITRFHTEAKAASVLVNPNTVTIYDFGQTDDGTLFIAMEHLDGVSLAERLERGALPWQHAASMASQVCRALSEAHRKRIVHRDLKPENIMLIAADDGSLLVKVLDFGIAKMLEVPGRQMKGVPVTQVGVIIGTPQYMSPEQARGSDPSPASDLYALGVILHEALSGVVPFDDDEPILLLGKHMQQPPPPVVSPFGEVPKSLERMVLQLLAKKPDERPGPAADVGAALKQYVGNLTISADEFIGHGEPSDSDKTLAVVAPEQPQAAEDADTDRTDLKQTIEPDSEDFLEVDQAPTKLTSLPESEPVSEADIIELDPTSRQELPETRSIDEVLSVDEDQTPTDEALALPLARGASLPSEEDKTRLRSVIVEPVPPEAAGLRADQVLRNEADEPTDQFRHVGVAEEDQEETTSGRGRLILLALLALVFIAAGAATGVIFFASPQRTNELPSPDRSLINGPSRVRDAGGELVQSASLTTTPGGDTDEGSVDAAVDSDDIVDGGTSWRPALEASRVKILPGEGSVPTPASQEELSEVDLRTSPAGAEVFVGEEKVCDATPCVVRLPTGKRTRIRFEHRSFPSKVRMILPGRDESLRVRLWRRQRSAPQTKTEGQSKRGQLDYWLD